MAARWPQKNCTGVGPAMNTAKSPDGRVLLKASDVSWNGAKAEHDFVNVLAVRNSPGGRASSTGAVAAPPLNCISASTVVC